VEVGDERVIGGDTDGVGIPLTLDLEYAVRSVLSRFDPI
jgi:hypothetical protein